MAKKKRGFIQEAIKKPGALSRQLDIPEKKNIPMTLLNRIIAAEPGDVITNPTETGKKRIKVTRKLEQRSILARNLKNINKKRRKK